MKKFGLLMGLVAVLGFGGLFAAQHNAINWQTDIGAAKQMAAKENKPVLILFTGSTWCPPCQKLEKKILSNSDFIKKASENFIFVRVEVPRSDRPERIKSLMEQYNVPHVPRFVVLNSKGEVVNSADFKDISPSAYLAHLRSLVRD